MNTTAQQPVKHIGRKISRMRELLGMKQQTLAAAMGVSQQAVSKLEQCEWIDPPRLSRVAAALGVSPEAIHRFNDDAVTEAVTKSDTPPERFIHSFNKLISVYERLLQCEREKVAMLQERLDGVSVRERRAG